jgi:hypothetical protein
MNRLVPNAKKLVTGVVAAGALSLALAGGLGAAPAGAATPALLTAAPKVGPHFNCNRAAKVQARIERAETQIAKGFPTLTHRQAKAKARGKTTRANRLQKRLSRLESPQLKEKLTKASQAIEAKCHVALPSGSSTSS